MAASQLSRDTRDLWVPQHVQILDEPPQALAFLRSWVSPSLPCIIRGVLDGSKARQWSLPALVERMGDQQITVAVTPDGWGDAIKPVGPDKVLMFVKPEERRMTMRALASVMSGVGVGAATGIPYLSHQNDSLRDEFALLADDAPKQLDWAAEAFGTPPDAVNLWIGDGRAVSSVHKDHYENIYCVIEGTKTFTLLPPSDIVFLGEATYPSGTHRFDEEQGVWQVEPDFNEDGTRKLVPWIALDPADSRAASALHPPFQHASPVTVTLHAGEALYIPALWYHRVSSAVGEVSIALNYWHDMSFDGRFVYYRLARAMAGLIDQEENAEDTSSGDPNHTTQEIWADEARLSRIEQLRVSRHDSGPNVTDIDCAAISYPTRQHSLAASMETLRIETHHVPSLHDDRLFLPR